MNNNHVMSDEEKEELRIALADRDYWQELAPEGWVVGGFTYRMSVTYHMMDGDSYAASASFDGGQVRFIKDLIEDLDNG